MKHNSVAPLGLKGVETTLIPMLPHWAIIGSSRIAGLKDPEGRPKESPGRKPWVTYTKKYQAPLGAS